MPRRERELSEGSMYHVVQRGVGQQMLFEDDADRRFFLRLLEKYVTDQGGKVYAWCLMSNHTHLLMGMGMDDLSKAMKAIGVSYARYFNDRYARSGHLFQDRFFSEAIRDDAQLMVTVRYIHANPLKAGAADGLSFPWSSYLSFVDPTAKPTGAELVQRDEVLELFGGLEAFERFHQSDNSDDRCLDIPQSAARAKLTEEQALRRAQEVMGAEKILNLKSLPKGERDAALARLKGEGISTRQIMRITGISLGVISRA